MTLSFARSTSRPFSFGITRSSMPIEIPRLRRVVEAEVLETIEHLYRQLEPAAQVACTARAAAEPFLLIRLVDERDLVRQIVVEDDAADRGLDDLSVELLHGRVQDVLIVVPGGQVHVRTAQSGSGSASASRRRPTRAPAERHPRSGTPAARRRSASAAASRPHPSRCRRSVRRPWPAASPWSSSSSRARCPARAPMIGVPFAGDRCCWTTA